ncbi:MAG TPA: response regulator [Chthonomonadaceae bacterium]|nr:response regulator [Chthonomonadaceae bacterium]
MTASDPLKSGQDAPAYSIASEGLAGKRVVLCTHKGIENLHLRRSLVKGRLLVVGEAKTAQQLIEIVSNERPDIVVVDASINTMPLEDLVRRLLAEHPATLILLTDRPDFGERASQLGAAACLERPYSAQELLSSLQQTVTEA